MSIIYSKLLIQFFFQEKLGIEILKENVQSNVEYVNSIPEEKVSDFFFFFIIVLFILQLLQKLFSCLFLV